MEDNLQTVDETSTIVEENASAPAAESGREQEAAAHALRERFALHGFELADEVQLAEVPGHVLAALLNAVPQQTAARQAESELRQELAQRIGGAQRLPRGVRERLAGMLETIRFDDSGRDEPALRVSDAVALLEETLPAHLLLAADEIEAAGHPRGDRFFTGDPRSLSDEDARHIAAQQLARSGYQRR